LAQIERRCAPDRFESTGTGRAIARVMTRHHPRAGSLLALALAAICGGACGGDIENSAGPAACAAAGGTCLVGSPSNCKSGSIGTQSCDPSGDPGGGVCCLPGEGAGQEAGKDEAGDDGSVVTACATAQDCSGLFFSSSSPACCTDHACTVDTPDDCTDANMQLIEASNYDQTCTADSDCVAVGEGNFCYAGSLNCQNSAAINKSAYAQYEADIAKTRGASCFAPDNCTLQFGPCCQSGTCQMGSQCPSPVMYEGDAAVDTGADAASDAATGDPRL
jgi:hypothetical protein